VATVGSGFKRIMSPVSSRTDNDVTLLLSTRDDDAVVDDVDVDVDVDEGKGSNATIRP
jgi:hypothetical protein